MDHPQLLKESQKATKILIAWPSLSAEKEKKTGVGGIDKETGTIGEAISKEDVVSSCSLVEVICG